MFGSVLSKFWEGVGSKLAERWVAVTGPALMFWLGGLLSWAYNQGGFSHFSTLTGWLDRQRGLTQLVVILSVLVGIAASGIVVERLTTPVLRLLEGYWPPWTDPLRRRLIDRLQKRAALEDAVWQRLAGCVLGDPDSATWEDISKFTRLDQRRRRRPNNPNCYMPTRIGNILRASETWPRDKYGLDAVVVWPRLWLLLPDTTRQELTSARGALDSAVAAAIWGLLFCLFATWTVLAIPLGLLVAVAGVKLWVPTRAEAFGDLVEAAYDLHRIRVYEQLRWSPPQNPHEEHHQGERLTSYLWRGSDEAEPSFESG